MKYARHLLWGGVTLLAGCAALPSALTATHQASLQIMPQVIAGRHVQASLAEGYTASDIHHFKVRLDKLAGDGVDPQQTPIVVTGEGSAANKGLTITSLASNTTYRLTAFAYKAADEGAESLINDPASSSVDVPVGTGLNAGYKTLPVALINKLFSGTATGSLSLTEGQFITLPTQVKYGALVTTLPATGYDTPYTVVYDSSGNLFFTSYNRIYKMDSSGVVTLFAGSSITGETDSDNPFQATFTNLQGITIDPSNNLYVSDNRLLRKITPQGKVTTLAGSYASGDNNSGTGNVARFGNMFGLAADAAGNVYGADIDYNKIRKFTPSGNLMSMSTIAGNGGTTELHGPTGLARDNDGNLYVADAAHARICKLRYNGSGFDPLVTIAGGTFGGTDGQGTSASIRYARTLTLLKNGSLMFTDEDGPFNTYVRLLSPSGRVSTVAGGAIGNGGFPGPFWGYVDGRGSEAGLSLSYGAAAHPTDGTVVMTDLFNGRLRKVSF
ncbi:Serine/threonine-protein kinase PknD [compost metagenome]